MASEFEQLQKERDKLMAQVAKIDTQLEEMKAERQNELLAQLRDLGWTPPGGRKRGKRDPKAGAACGICGFATEPYHDGRLKAHRDQGKSKKPLTVEEMRAAGLKKVA